MSLVQVAELVQLLPLYMGQPGSSYDQCSGLMHAWPRLSSVHLQPRPGRRTMLLYASWLWTESHGRIWRHVDAVFTGMMPC